MEVKSWRKRLDRLALPLGVLGLAGIALYNWRQWECDKELLAQLSKPEPLLPLENWPDLPKVSVLVAAWNESDFIERHIQSFLSLRYPHRELVLCAGGKDGTFVLVQRYISEQLIVLEQLPGEGKQRALARCLHQATGTVVFLTDADCLLDDKAFERTLLPVASGKEQVCSGSLQPLDEQLGNPFVFSQMAGQLYRNYHKSAYAGGLLGGNCAISRELLERSGGLIAHASTGTDYVLAKMLLRTGARICKVPESRIITHYPTTAWAYMRQRRRWLRNVTLHGWRFGAYDDVRDSVRTSLVGLAMLLAPLIWFLLGPIALLVWSLFLIHALLSRERYLFFASLALNRPIQGMTIALQLPVLFLDLVCWVQPLADYLFPQKQEEW